MKEEEPEPQQRAHSPQFAAGLASESENRWEILTVEDSHLLAGGDLQKAIREVVFHVFENMYFMFPEAVDGIEPARSGPLACLKATVTVRNTPWVFSACASQALVADMAKNFLGTDQSISEVELVDVFKEAVNVMAGNLVTSLALDENVGLDVPVAQKLRGCDELGRSAGVVFSIDSEFLRVGVVNSKA
jgi:hypothetical protein